MEFFEMTANEKALQEMFDRLVPVEGKSETVAGEIVRAFERINYRFHNDGDRIGLGYGKVTCNAPARYLIAKCNTEVAEVIENIWGIKYDDAELNDLTNAVYEFLLENPELETTRNNENMWDYEDECEDNYDCYADSEEDDWYDDCEDEFIDNGDCEDDSDY